MKTRRSTRLSVIIAAAFLAAALGSAAPGRALPVVKYKCTGTINYHGHAFEFLGMTFWSWSFDSHGTCIDGVLKKVTYHTSGFAMPACGPPGYVSDSPNYVGNKYLAYTTVTNRSGVNTTYDQQWVDSQVGNVIVQINAWHPVPSRDIPIGGIVGLGVVIHGNRTGPREAPTLSGPIEFAFGPKEIPNTDQPDGTAC